MLMLQAQVRSSSKWDGQHPTITEDSQFQENHLRHLVLCPTIYWWQRLAKLAQIPKFHSTVPWLAPQTQPYVYSSSPLKALLLAHAHINNVGVIFLFHSAFILPPLSITILFWLPWDRIQGEDWVCRGKSEFLLQKKSPTFNVSLSGTLAIEAPPDQGRSYFMISGMKRDFYWGLKVLVLVLE